MSCVVSDAVSCMGGMHWNIGAYFHQAAVEILEATAARGGFSPASAADRRQPREPSVDRIKLGVSFTDCAVVGDTDDEFVVRELDHRLGSFLRRMVAHQLVSKINAIDIFSLSADSRCTAPPACALLPYTASFALKLRL